MSTPLLSCPEPCIASFDPAITMDPALADESRAEVPIAVVVATLTTATMAVLLRSYTRLVIIKQFGYDDVGAIISLVVPFCQQKKATGGMD